MPSCCSIYQSELEGQFDENKAAEELADYRRNGPAATTRMLLDGIARASAVQGTLLDIGCGIGSLTFDLLARGAMRAVAIDASTAAIAAARREAERRGLAGAVQFLHADFVAVAAELSQAQVVALDRVVCCYPSFEPLLAGALGRAARCLALSYPREAFYVRLAMRLENAQRWLTGNSFRTFVHPVAAMRKLVQDAGFALASRQQTWMWCADVYLRA